MSHNAAMPRRGWNFQRLRSESSYWRSCILIVAGHLDLFDWIGRRKKSSRDLAAHFGGSAAGWEIFLDALCGMGLMRKHGEQYANGVFAARYLTAAGAISLLPAYDAWNIWGGLASALINGRRPATQKPFASDRNKAARLLHSLDLDAREIAFHLIKKLPLSRSRTLLDVGGGLGAFSIAFCRHYPRLRATLVEHPRIFPLARRAVGEAGMARRVRVIGADFSRHALPQGFDTIFLSNVLHAHSIAENHALLLKLQRCLNPRGQLIVRDVFMSPQRTAPEWGALFSVQLLLHTPEGRCYAIDEIRAWLRQAGFSRIKGPFRSSPLPFDPDSILIATNNDIMKPRARVRRGR
ncbi:MAG TPA: methyltransferase [Candidatus Binatia bacterium]|nr:methyltransferase [Candidatus Binatia bacterium]